MTNRVVPVALPGPEEQSPANGSTVGAHPAVGPVVPLNVSGGGEGGDLLGATTDPTQRESDPIGARVLIRGDAIAAPPGRADDFSWPRADANANDAADVPPAPVAPAPPAAAAPPLKGVGGKTDTNKNDANKNHAKRSSDAKSQPAPNSPPAKPHRARRELDGAPPRPPLPIGPAADSTR